MYQTENKPFLCVLPLQCKFKQPVVRGNVPNHGIKLWELYEIQFIDGLLLVKGFDIPLSVFENFPNL